MNKVIISFFRENGEKRNLSSNTELFLNKQNSIFAFDGDPVIIFAIKRDQEEPARIFIADWQSSLFFSLDSLEDKNEFDVVAVSTGNTVVYEIPESKYGLLDKPGLKKTISDHLEIWIDLLSKSLTRPSPPGTAAAVTLDEPQDVERGAVIVFKKTHFEKKKETTVWIEVLKGKLFLFHEVPFTFDDGFWPFSEYFWYQAEVASRVKGIDTAAFIKKEGWQKGAQTFSTLFHLCFPLAIKLKLKNEEKILEERKREQEQSLENAITQLESSFTESRVPFFRMTPDPLQQIFEVIGYHLGVKFTYPRTSQLSSNIDERIQLISEGSRIPSRKIRLRKTWWKEDCGPFLGFYGNEKKPVFLLNSLFSNYTMFNDRSRVRVNKKIAKDIQLFGYIFHKPFPSNLKSGREVIRFVWEQQAKLILSIIFYSILGGVIAFFPAIATKLLFRYAVPESDPSLIFFTTLGLLFSAIGFLFFYYMRNYSFLKMEGMSSYLVQSALWDRLLKLPAHFFRKFSVGDLYWRTSSVEEIRSLISGYLSTLSLAGIFSIFYLIIMAVFSPLLSLIVFVFSLIGMGATLICARMKMKILRESLEIQGKIRSTVVQMISGIGKLRVAGAEKSAFSYWSYYFSKHKFLQSKIQNLHTVIYVLSAFIPIVLMWAIYYAVVEWVGIKEITLSDFLAFNIAFGSFTAGFFPSYLSIMQIIKVSPFWERSLPLIQEPLEEVKEKIDPGKLSGDIRVDSVTFGYDVHRPPILNGVSLEIHPREFIGIAGLSGSGKSTIIRLILGFEKPTSGSIYFDGKDFSSLDPRALRKQMGVVLQGEGIMAGSLIDNLVCGGTYSEAQIDEALSLSGFDQDLSELPMGLYTYVPMNADTLSGGQKQRLLLARALLSKPSIFIFDEATSSLDNRSQEIFMQNIASLNVTRIIVAQRLSTLRNADKIYVLDKGTISQSGTFEELSKSSGLFSEMLAKQKI